jgi:hypothetical protein
MECTIVDCDTNEVITREMTEQEEADFVASLEGMPSVDMNPVLTPAEKLERAGLTVDELRGLLDL